VFPTWHFVENFSPKVQVSSHGSRANLSAWRMRPRRDGKSPKRVSRRFQFRNSIQHFRRMASGGSRNSGARGKDFEGGLFNRSGYSSYLKNHSKYETIYILWYVHCISCYLKLLVRLQSNNNLLHITNPCQNAVCTA